MDDLKGRRAELVKEKIMNSKDTAVMVAAYTLKPCPFCGGMDIRQHSGYPLNFWVVRCKDCGGKIQTYGSQDQAIAAWNRRIYDGTKTEG